MFLHKYKLHRHLCTQHVFTHNQLLPVSILLFKCSSTTCPNNCACLYHAAPSPKEPSTSTWQTSILSRVVLILILPGFSCNHVCQFHRGAPVWCVPVSFQQPMPRTMQSRASSGDHAFWNYCFYSYGNVLVKLKLQYTSANTLKWTQSHKFEQEKLNPWQLTAEKMVLPNNNNNNSNNNNNNSNSNSNNDNNNNNNDDDDNDNSPTRNRRRELA